MLSAEPSRRLDLMTLAKWGIISPTSIYSCQRTANRSLPPIPRPKPVSDERIAPNQCTRIAKRRLIENDWACGGALASKVVSLARNRVISSLGYSFGR
jgi:hypothetical protein